MGWLKRQTNETVAGDDTEAMRVAIAAFDRGALTAYTSLRAAVATLSRDEALEVIDDAIARLESRGG